MKPLTMPQHFALHTPAVFSPPALLPLRRYTLLRASGSLWYPALLTPACAAGNIAATPNRPPSDISLGSLVDGKSKLFAAPNPGADFARSIAAPAPGTNPITFRINSYQTGCGVPTFANL